MNDLPIAAPFWGNLDIQLSGGIFTATRGTAPNRRFIVQYENHRRVLTVTYQLTTHELRSKWSYFESTGQIEFRYEDVSNNQNLVAVGITDGTGTNFAEVGIGKTDTDIIVNDNTRIVFTPSYYSWMLLRRMRQWSAGWWIKSSDRGQRRGYNGDD